MRILFSFPKILILIFIYTAAHSEDIKWKDDGFNNTDNYIQSYNKGFKEINIDGNLKKHNITYLSTFPRNKKLNKKNWECRQWSIKETNSDKEYIRKEYALNDCLPCLDK